jgi:hypothetical protein
MDRLSLSHWQSFIGIGRPLKIVLKCFTKLDQSEGGSCGKC